jgi:trehalose 6-phosphate phosphatase
MKALERQASYASFLDRLRSASARVLLLDYDGTLAPFCADRNLAFPYPEVPDLLARIMAEGTRVVLISGRPARELLLLGGIHPHPEIWGSHGLERLKPDGSYELGVLPRDQQMGLLMAITSLRSDDLERQIELKPGGVAVHWRGLTAQQIEDIKSRVLQRWIPLRNEYSLNLLDFDGGLELRVPGKDKGDAVNTVLNEIHPDAAVAYLGDDQTDEDAFLALKGKGLTALVRSQSRPTAADVWLQPPQELIQFFQEWLDAQEKSYDAH